MRTSHFIHFAALILASAISGQAGTVTFTGPQDANGNTCNPTGGHCIIGDRREYQMFSAAITSPVSSGGNWTLVIQTNYGVPLPGASETIPGFYYRQPTLNDPGAFFAMCDFLIQWDNKDYGIVLHGHDGYLPGTLVQTDGYQLSGAIMAAQGELSPRPSLPALVKMGGIPLGAGTVIASANAGADGLTKALYRVQVNFTAPVGFLSTGTFHVHGCSYVCDNGIVSGNGTFVGLGGDTVPEPGTVFLSIAGLGLAAGLQRYRNRRSRGLGLNASPGAEEQGDQQ